MRSSDTSREPCPDRILDDVGGAFAMGAVGGSMGHFLKGAYQHPWGERFSGGIQNMRMKTPRTAGGFAVWGGLFSTFDCSLVYLRQKEDPWNSIISGAATSGLLSMRQGLRVASRSAMVGGVLLALIEGGMIMVNKFTTQIHTQEQFLETDGGLPGGMAQETTPLPESQSTSWFGGLFGGDMKEETNTSGVKTEILETFDSPIPPTFELK